MDLLVDVAMHCRHMLFPIILGFAGLTLTDVHAQEDTGQKVFKSGTRSTVLIMIPRGDAASVGSGSVIDATKRLVITNEHVVGRSTEAIVIFPTFEKGKVIADKERYLKNIEKGGFVRAKVIHTDQLRDLALLQVDKLPPGITQVKFAAQSPDTGAKVHSIGNPAASGALWVYTPGQVRAVYTKEWLAGRERTRHKATIIEATSPTSPGDSGGPLFNDKGEQVGVTQGGLVDPKAQGYSYFIDVTEVKAFLGELKIKINSAPPTVDDPGPSVVKKDTPTETKTSVVDRDEKLAAGSLSLIRPLAADPARRDTAVLRLRELLKKYPKTEAAKEAQKLLDQLK